MRGAGRGKVWRGGEGRGRGGSTVTVRRQAGSKAIRDLVLFPPAAAWKGPAV